MREVLFRGKTLNVNEWVIGAGVYKSDGYTWIITDDVTKTENRGTGSDAIIPVTVGQYTGLTDKNGTKIFEGDVVREVDIKHKGEVQIKGNVYEVKMRKGCWVIYNCNFKLEYEKWDFLNTFASSVEVIGNIHDTPELLGDK